MRLTKQQEKEVMPVYKDWWYSYINGDVKTYDYYLDDEYRFIGSTEAEAFLNRADTTKFFEATADQLAGKAELRNSVLKAEYFDGLIFITELADTYLLYGEEWTFYGKFRFSSVLKKNKEGWRFIYQHFSTPDSKAQEGETIGLEKITTENQELRDAIKRRTIELENKTRELEIETALEKVRSSALAMREPADMVDVCRIISDQLQTLGIANIRNVQTAIINEKKSTYLNYQYFTSYNKSGIEEAEYNKHPKAREMAETMKMSANASYSQSFDGKDLDVFREYRKHDNQFPDPILDESTSLHFYFYSIGPGALGLSTYNFPLSENELNILKRFRNVFELAYRRFIDIELAIAQAKEAKIEAALEKVRAVAMSMNKPDDLLNVCETLFTEFHKLGFDEMRNAMINIHNDEKETFINYDYSDEIGKSINHLTYNIHPVIEKQIKQIRSANDAFSETSFTGKDLEEWKKFRRKIGEKDDSRTNNLSALYYYFYSIGTGSIGISTFNPIGEEKLALIKRFRNVFNLSYQRYSDIALAEGQAREAQIAAALERVRSRTMGMQKSEELKDVIRVVYEQFVHLKINVDHAGFVVDYTPKGDWHFWIADEQQIPSKITHPYFESVWANQFNEAKEKGIDFFATDLNFEEKNKFYNELLSYVPGLPEASKDFYLSCPGLAASTVLLENVSLYIENFSGTPYTDEVNKILIRFGKVFQQTYTRFLDLQRAETQNKIIQAENDRKTKELEDARQLQLSMLPKKLPQIPNLDIAVYMKTATEVGGDYYDYNVDADGTLTFVVGDATGHGMMSGMMVSIMKSFFISSKSNIEIKTFFENANNSIKDMNLGRLMMACMGVQIKSEKIIATNAGMPSLLYFRNKSQKAGEFVSNNLPLGGMKGTKYLLKEIRYEKGDTLLLMSDGFAELKNKNNEQYGYARVKKEFISVVQNSSDQIIDHLKNSASAWADGVEPDDDVTFVVIKVK